MVGSQVSSVTDLKSFIQNEAVARYPEEACGLIIRRGSKSVPIACKNVAEDPKVDFLFDTMDYADILENTTVVGVWHTHIDRLPTPTQADLVGCEATNLPWFILSVYRNEAGDFSFSDIEKLEPSGYKADYVGRPYVFGVMDCWSLVRDYYAREYGIQLSDFPRIPEFWKKDGFDFFGDNWKSEGFVSLIDQEPKEGDLFLISTDSSGKNNHIAVYLGNELILHHCHGRLSKRDVYGGYWQTHTTHHLRHNTKC